MVAPVVAPVVAPNVPVPVTPIEPAPMTVPAYHEPVVARPPPRAVPSFTQGTAMAFEVSRGPAIPFREGAPASPLSAPSQPSPPRVGSGTSLAVEVPRGLVTPFAAAPPPPGPPPPRAPPPAPVGSGTAITPAEPASPALPFREIATLGFDLARYVALVAAREEPGAVLAGVLGQLAIDVAAHEQIESFWRKKLADDGLLALDFGRRLMTVQKDLAARRAARPVALAKEAAPVPELNVEQYAWVVATLRRTAPAELPVVLARFRLSAETRRELEDHWRARMAADSALQQEFLAALGRHLAKGGG